MAPCWRHKAVNHLGIRWPLCGPTMKHKGRGLVAGGPWPHSWDQGPHSRPQYGQRTHIRSPGSGGPLLGPCSLQGPCTDNGGPSADFLCWGGFSEFLFSLDLKYFIRAPPPPPPPPRAPPPPPPRPSNFEEHGWGHSSSTLVYWSQWKKEKRGPSPSQLSCVLLF